MSSPAWQVQGGHPPLSLLLLHLEGELSGVDAQTIAAHVNRCWECRTRCEHLHRGIFQFMEYQAQEKLPPPPQNKNNFSRRLHQLAARETQRSATSFFRTTMGRLSSRWSVLAGATAAAVICLLIATNSSQSLAAGQVLSRAIASSRTFDKAESGHFFYQKILVTQGALRFERTLYRGAGQSAAFEALSDPGLRNALAIGGVNWADPLNPSDFAKWRNAHPQRSENVLQNQATTTVETTLLDDGPVRQGSLTVRSQDWRPVKRHLEYRGQPPLEITEVAFELRTAPPGPSQISALAPRLEHPTVPAALPTGDTALVNLEESELRLWETFHALNVDVKDSPSIWQADNRVMFRVFPETPSEKQAILAAISGIAHVAEASPVTNVITNGPTNQTGAFTTTPPLADALASDLGSSESANRYLDTLREHYAQFLAQSQARQRLATRYPPETARALPPDLQTRVETLASDYLVRMIPFAQQFVRDVTPVLISMQRRISVSVSEGAGFAPCGTWQRQADVSGRAARDLEESFLSLFVQEQTDTPAAPEVATTLKAAADARIILSSAITALCPAP